MKHVLSVGGPNWLKNLIYIVFTLLEEVLSLNFINDCYWLKNRIFSPKQCFIAKNCTLFLRLSCLNEFISEILLSYIVTFSSSYMLSNLIHFDLWKQTLTKCNQSYISDGCLYEIRGRDWNQPTRSCSSETQPFFGAKYPAGVPLSWVVVNKVLARIKKPVYLLDITFLSQMRKDAHPSRYSGGHGGTDCSHWCLPGLPDTWNDLLYAALFGWRK